ATHSYAGGKSSAAAAIDGDPRTGWSIEGGVGRRHTAVFTLDKPLDGAREVEVAMLFERYHAAGLGRFRIAVTTDPKPAEARDLPPDIEALLRIPIGQHTAQQRQHLLPHSLMLT